LVLDVSANRAVKPAKRRIRGFFIVYRDSTVKSPPFKAIRGRRRNVTRQPYLVRKEFF
jgi:hypothetical protein